MASSFGRRDREADSSPLSFLRFWRADEGEVARELKAYHSLSPLQSARGRSALLAVLLAILSSVAGLARADVAGAVAGVLIWLLLAFFMYRGVAWTFIAAMLLFTIDRAGSLFAGAALLLVIIWWAVGMGLFYRAFAIERARRAAETTSSPTA